MVKSGKRKNTATLEVSSKEIEKKAPKPEISCSIRCWTPHVTHQKEEQTCKAIAYADMLGTLLRMYGMYKLVLSPQQLIEVGDNVNEIWDVLQIYGIHSIEVCPFKRIKCNGRSHVDGENRFRLTSIESYDRRKISEKTFEDAIMANFLPDGDHCPLVAYIYCGELEDPQTALDAYEIKPFRHGPEDENKEADHTLLIVGVDTTHEDEDFHYALIKNSYSTKWGKDGFSKVAFSVIRIVDKPNYTYKSFLSERRCASASGSTSSS